MVNNLPMGEIETNIMHLYNTTKQALERGASFKKVIERYESMGFVDVLILCNGHGDLTLHFDYVGQNIRQHHIFEFTLSINPDMCTEDSSSHVTCVHFSLKDLCCRCDRCVESARIYPHHEIISL